MSRIVVDLTAILPNGENGGAKIVVIELLQKLAVIAPQHDFILLTSNINHDYLSFLDSNNMVRHFLSQSSRLLKDLNADLFFCPFTVVPFFEHDVPIVSVVYDLQCFYYPHFFTHDDEFYRKKSFLDASHLADRLICISNHVRQTILENSELPPEKVITSHIRLSKRLNNITLDKNLFNSSGLQENEFLLYPANFWPHKNHIGLINAFHEYCNKNTDSKLKIVFTGSPNKNMDYLKSLVKKLRLENKIIFLGFLSTDQFANLMQSCRALIFPSLYEGFGMPVLEAMAFGKPVLCSSVTSLPEVAGDAAILFNPHKPDEIRQAIEKIEKNDEVITDLITCGNKRFAYFSDTKKMAEEYLHVFEEAMKHHHYKFVRDIKGIDVDGWMSNYVKITYEPSPLKRELQLDLALPEWRKISDVNIQIGNIGNETINNIIKSGQSNIITLLLNEQGGVIELAFEPCFQLSHEDTRLVSCFAKKITVISQNQEPEILIPRHNEPYSFSLFINGTYQIKNTVENILFQKNMNVRDIIVSNVDSENIPVSLKCYDARLKWLLEPPSLDDLSNNVSITRDIIAWLNAGETYSPGALQIVSQFFATHPDIDIVYGQVEGIEEKDVLFKLDNVEPWNINRPFYKSYLSRSAVFVRKNAIKKAGLFSNTLKDITHYEICVRLALHGAKIAFLPKILVPSKQQMTLLNPNIYRRTNNIMLKSLLFIPNSYTSYYAHSIVRKYVKKSNKLLYLITYIMMYLYSKMVWNSVLFRLAKNLKNSSQNKLYRMGLPKNINSVQQNTTN